MKLIELYISEVGRQLHQKNRADIQAEIRSTVQDMLDERSQQSGKPIDDELILEVLQEYGSPEKIAASYQGERSLIGPKLYPAYIKVLQIVLPIMGVLALIGLGISLAHPDSTIGTGLETTALDNTNLLIYTIARATSEFFGSIISALGSITLIFALLERFIPDLKTKEARWDARTLLKISPPEQVKATELIVEIFFTGLAILVFNFFPQVIGFTPSLNSVVETGTWQGVTFIPFLSEAFLGYIPFLTATWVLAIILDGILIQRGRWETWSRWFSVGVKALGISIAIVMLAGPSLVAVSADLLVSAGFTSPGSAEILVTLMNLGVRLGLVMAIIVGVLELVRMLLRLFQGKAPVVLVSK